MARPVTLFTGQWADLPLEELAKKASAWGYDGLELACWGDHFGLVQGGKASSECTCHNGGWFEDLRPYGRGYPQRRGGLHFAMPTLDKRASYHQ